MKLTDNFTLSEFTRSSMAIHKGMLNDPGVEEVKALENLARNLLQPLRDLYGRPVAVTSGYRCPELNEWVGGVPNSQHVKGEAADVACESPGELVECLRRSGLDFDQCIRYSTFVHLSLKRAGGNRKQYLKGKY